MTRLTEANIQFVKRHEVNGNFNFYTVSLKGGVSEVRTYPREGDLPKTVRNFISKRRVEIQYNKKINDNLYVIYIWRK